MLSLTNQQLLQRIHGMSKKIKREWTDEDDIEFTQSFDKWAKNADKKYDNVDWEQLAKQLQEALASEIKENQEKDELIEMMRTIIYYLEIRIGIYKGESIGNQSI
jgi:uncharacterized protein YukE